MTRKVITISREYGSGGRLIGRQVAETLGIPFYDRELISLVAKESGFDLSFIEETGEYSTSGSLLYNFSMSGAYLPHNLYSQDPMPVGDKVHIFQTKVIRETAAKGPCVIVGRCADYILRERTDCLHVLIFADMEHKRGRAAEYPEIDQKNIERDLKRKDKARANHYRRYTGLDWGNAKNYHLALDSGLLGIEGCAEIIAKACSV